MKRLILFFAFTTFGFSQNYYLYVAAESDDTVSLIKFDGKRSSESLSAFLRLSLLSWSMKILANGIWPIYLIIMIIQYFFKKLIV